MSYRYIQAFTKKRTLKDQNDHHNYHGSNGPPSQFPSTAHLPPVATNQQHLMMAGGSITAQ